MAGHLRCDGQLDGHPTTDGSVPDGPGAGGLVDEAVQAGAVQDGLVRDGLARRRSGTARRQSDVRDHNLALVLEHVHVLGSISRADLTRVCGLNRSTIAGLVATLVGDGLVVDGPPGGTAGAGRPSHVVTARQDGPFAIAVELDIGRLVVALVGIGGRVLDRRTATPPPGVGPTEVVAAVCRAVRSLVGRIAGQRTPDDAVPAGLGVSVPGTVRLFDGVVSSAPNLAWSDVPLAGLLARALGPAHPGLEVTVGNDADLAVRAEHLRGIARGIDDVVFLVGNVGVGAGIIVGGRPLPGARGFSGELGHMVLELDGARCSCGGRGCFETLVGSAALCAAAGVGGPAGADGAPSPVGADGPPSPADTRRVLAEARAGVPAARAAVDLVAHRLGIGLASIVNLLDPTMVVVGGHLEEVLAIAPERVRSALAGQLTDGRAAAVAVRAPALGRDASLLGAAELGFDTLFCRTVGLPLLQATTRFRPAGPARVARVNGVRSAGIAGPVGSPAATG